MKILVAGPCVLERDGNWLADIGEGIKSQLPAGYEFFLKTSFAKGNRTEGASFRGLTDGNAIRRAFERARIEGFDLCTDVHTVDDVAWARGNVSLVQIPERLSRETALLEAASHCEAVLLKCGLSMSPSKYAAARAKLKGAKRIIGCYRGTAFGDEVIFDIRRMWEMSHFGPLIADITHSTMQLNGEGRRRLSVPYARAAVALGCNDGLFAEVHPSPKDALSDAQSQLSILNFGTLIRSLVWQ